MSQSCPEIFYISGNGKHNKISKFVRPRTEMKILLSHIFVLALSAFTFAHEYHFAFAEVAYNSTTKTVQATISLSAHDFEHDLFENGTSINHLESYVGNKLMELSLSQEILKHFKMQLGNETCVFTIIGFEVLNTGIANFYFESQVMELQPTVDVLFDLMMDGNSKQQNKLTFITPFEKLTAEFLFNARTQQLTLSKLEE